MDNNDDADDCTRVCSLWWWRRRGEGDVAAVNIDDYTGAGTEGPRGLYEKGIITNEQYEAAKKKLIEKSTK
jgi:hypothetical protein